MTRLYELQDQLVAIDNILAENTDPDTNEILSTAKDEILNQIDGKVENILNYIADCKAKSDQLREEAARLSYKRGVLDKKAEYLRNMLLWFMKTNDKKKDSFGNWDVTVAKTAGRVVLDATDDKYPDQFKKLSWDIDKTALKEAMVDGKVTITKNGQEIVLAHLEEGESLRIK